MGPLTTILHRVRVGPFYDDSERSTARGVEDDDENSGGLGGHGQQRSFADSDHVSSLARTRKGRRQFKLSVLSSLPSPSRNPPPKTTTFPIQLSIPLVKISPNLTSPPPQQPRIPPSFPIAFERSLEDRRIESSSSRRRVWYMGRWERMRGRELAWRELCSCWVVDLGMVRVGTGLNSS